MKSVCWYRGIMNADLKDKFLIILEFYLPYLACKDFGD